MDQDDYDLLKTADQVARLAGDDAPGKIDIDQDLSAGDVLGAGTLEAVVMHTPGHAEGGVSPLRSRAELIASDTLFAGGVGRTDLPGGNFRRSCAR